MLPQVWYRLNKGDNHAGSKTDVDCVARLFGGGTH